MDCIVYNERLSKNYKADLKIFKDEINEKLDEGYTICKIYSDFFHLSNEKLKFLNSFVTVKQKSMCFFEYLYDNR